MGPDHTEPDAEDDLVEPAATGPAPEAAPATGTSARRTVAVVVAVLVVVAVVAALVVARSRQHDSGPAPRPGSSAQAFSAAQAVARTANARAAVPGAPARPVSLDDVERAAREVSSLQAVSQGPAMVVAPGAQGHVEITVGGATACVALTGSATTATATAERGACP